MTLTATNALAIPALSRSEAMALARTEYARFGELLRSLAKDEWSRPSDCDRWDVKAIVSHVVEMSAAMSSFREMMAQQKAGKAIAKREGLAAFDGWTELQARAHAEATPREVVGRYERSIDGVMAVRARTSPLRLLRFPSPPYGWFSMAFLRDDILTRDVWMHRVDVSRATGRDVVLSDGHDGRFVANIVRDLAKRWTQPFTLTLTGTAGGTYVNGTGGVSATLDAVEFCRILSGRSSGHGLPTDVVPF